MGIVVTRGIRCFHHNIYYPFCEIEHVISVLHDPVKHEVNKHIGVDASYVHACIIRLLLFSMGS
jgi:hypothetical protein